MVKFLLRHSRRRKLLRADSLLRHSRRRKLLRADSLFRHSLGRKLLRADSLLRNSRRRKLLRADSLLRHSRRNLLRADSLLRHSRGRRGAVSWLRFGWGFRLFAASPSIPLSLFRHNGKYWRQELRRPSRWKELPRYLPQIRRRRRR